MAVNSDDFRYYSARRAAGNKAREIVEQWQRGGLLQPLIADALMPGIIAEQVALAEPEFYCVIGTRAYDRKFKTSMQEAIDHAANLFSRPGCGAPLLVVKVAQIVEPLPPSAPLVRARDPLDSDRRMLGLE